ncbi:MAG: SDR family oxidoreductase [Acidobacteria bacterium]|nr:SDR family oxidoreductase [Acidobacteriota bacterium]
MILVTGATGFVGGHVVHALRAQDKPVRALARDPRHAGRLESWGATVTQGDMTDAASIRRAADGCDAVVHLVAVRQGPDARFQRVMVDGTRDLLAAAREAGVRRFVHMSALGTGEETKDLVPYFRAKWQTEQLVQESGIPVTPIIGKGRQRIQPIWIDDVAAYFALAVDRDGVEGRIFELGGPDAVTWNEFWERLKRVRRSRRPSVHVPVPLMRLNALVTERLPGDIPLTNDLLTMLEHGDNVVADTAAVETFRMPLVPLDDQLRRAT